MAQIRREQKAATDDVARRHGDKKPSELSSSERRQIIFEQQQAERAVLDKHGVDAKEFARYSTRMSREERAATEAAQRQLDLEAAAQAGKGDKKSDEVTIERGTGKGGKAKVIDITTGKESTGSLKELQK